MAANDNDLNHTMAAILADGLQSFAEAAGYSPNGLTTDLTAMVERTEQIAEQRKNNEWQDLVDEQKAKGLCLFVDPETLLPCAERPFTKAAHYCSDHNVGLCFGKLMGRR